MTVSATPAVVGLFILSGTYIGGISLLAGSIALYLQNKSKKTKNEKRAELLFIGIACFNLIFALISEGGYENPFSLLLLPLIVLIPYTYKALRSKDI